MSKALASDRTDPAKAAAILGLRENLAQFTLLVVVNAFVSAMVGMERSILPAIAEKEFHLAARAAILSFIVVFGVTKALTNYLAGRLSDAFGRKIALVVGWLIAAPVPFLLMWAPSWRWVLLANVFMGVSQGLTWSTTVIIAARQKPVVGQPGRARQQPERRDGVGHLSALLRRGRTAPRADRVACRDLPRGVGNGAALHRRALRPHRPQMAHRGQHVDPGGRHPRGARRPWASTDSGGIWAMPSEHCWPVLQQTSLGSRPP